MNKSISLLVARWVVGVRGRMRAGEQRVVAAHERRKRSGVRASDGAGDA